MNKRNRQVSPSPVYAYGAVARRTECGGIAFLAGGTRVPFSALRSIFPKSTFTIVGTVDDATI